MVSGATTRAALTAEMMVTTTRQHQSDVSSTSSSTSPTAYSSPSNNIVAPHRCCTRHECNHHHHGRTVMKNVREELRFLSHQVAQLMRIFSIKYCQCEDCRQRGDESGGQQQREEDRAIEGVITTATSDQGTHGDGRGSKSTPSDDDIPVFESIEKPSRRRVEAVIKIDKVTEMDPKMKMAIEIEEEEERTPISIPQPITNIPPINGNSVKVEHPENQHTENSQSRRKRPYPTATAEFTSPMIINVDQLLPKLLATKQSEELHRCASSIESISPDLSVKKSPQSAITVSTLGGGCSVDDEEEEDVGVEQLTEEQSSEGRMNRISHGTPMSAPAYLSDCPPPLTKVPRYDFAHMAYGMIGDRRSIGNMDQSYFMTRQLSTSSLGVELPKNCVDSFDMHMENTFMNSPGLLPTIPSAMFLRNEMMDERNYMKAFTAALPTMNPSVGPGLPLVSYGPKSSTFFCGVCKREFSNVYYKRHMIVHANARPHVCDVCGKRFNERSNMMKHRQRLHVP